jgi:hypothetical protein
MAIRRVNLAILQPTLGHRAVLWAFSMFWPGVGLQDRRCHASTSLRATLPAEGHDRRRDLRRTLRLGPNMLKIRAHRRASGAFQLAALGAAILPRITPPTLRRRKCSQRYAGSRRMPPLQGAILMRLISRASLRYLRTSCSMRSGGVCPTSCRPRATSRSCWWRFRVETPCTVNLALIFARRTGADVIDRCHFRITVPAMISRRQPPPRPPRRHTVKGCTQSDSEPQFPLPGARHEPRPPLHASPSATFSRFEGGCWYEEESVRNLPDRRYGGPRRCDIRYQ